MRASRLRHLLLLRLLALSHVFGFFQGIVPGTPPHRVLRQPQSVLPLMIRQSELPLHNWKSPADARQVYLHAISSATTGDEEPSGARKGKINLTLYAPLWTLVAATFGILKSSWAASATGSLDAMQGALAVLMLAMGLAITPKEIQCATQQPAIILLNIVLCFGMMPLLAFVMTKCFHFSKLESVGTILLGCVSGGQASNLFTLLAGGDVALSVVCTLSTTLLGVVATPALVKWFLGTSVTVDGLAVLRSVATLVLVPLLTGLIVGRIVSEKRLDKIRSFCPKIGLAATLCLVSGGAANSASSFFAGQSWNAIILASIAFPLIGGAIALGVVSSTLKDAPEKSKRALVIEVLSKSPTLAHVLSVKHFGVAAATIPAASMVTLAVLGALVASLWTVIVPLHSDR